MEKKEGPNKKKDGGRGMTVNKIYEMLEILCIYEVWTVLFIFKTKHSCCMSNKIYICYQHNIVLVTFSTERIRSPHTWHIYTSQMHSNTHTHA